MFEQQRRRLIKHPAGALTVAVLAQGPSWAVAVTQAFLVGGSMLFSPVRQQHEGQLVKKEGQPAATRKIPPGTGDFQKMKTTPCQATAMEPFWHDALS